MARPCPPRARRPPLPPTSRPGPTPPCCRHPTHQPARQGEGAATLSAAPVTRPFGWVSSPEGAATSGPATWGPATLEPATLDPGPFEGSVLPGRSSGAAAVPTSADMASTSMTSSPVASSSAGCPAGALGEPPGRALDAIVIFSPHGCHQELCYRQRPNTQKLQLRPLLRLHASIAGGPLLGRGRRFDGPGLFQPSPREAVAGVYELVAFIEIEGGDAGDERGGDQV